MQNSNNKSYPQIILLSLIVGASFFLGGFLLGRSHIANSGFGGYVITGDTKKEYKSVDTSILWEVWDKLEANFIEDDLDGQKLIDGAVKGLVEATGNEYNAYLNSEETNEYLNSNAGEFEGIGVTLRFTGDYTMVESVIEGFPAYKAGVRSGDIIIKVDSEDTQGDNAFEVAEKIRGEAGSKVVLSLARENILNPVEIEITREKIDIDSISYQMLDNGIAKIKIIQFTEDSLSSFNSQWDEVAKEVSKEHPKAIIVDLRNNPGGFVDGVVHVASDFFKEDTLIMSERNKNGDMFNKKTTKDGIFGDIPIVVLVNEGSASASEIFAGAIQDNDRGEIIGVKTVGKGVEQTILRLSNGGSLHVVFQEWVLPSGRVISKDEPIIPDIEIEMTNDDYKQRKDPQLDEAIRQIR